MSIQTELTRITNAKAAIKTAIEGKGVTVPDGTLLDGMAALIESIEAGGGGTPLSMFDISIGEFVPASSEYTVTVDTGWGAAPNSSKFYGAFIVGFQPAGIANDYRNICKFEFYNAGINGSLQNYKYALYASDTATKFSSATTYADNCVYNSDGTVKLVGYNNNWTFAAGHKYLWMVFKEK